MTDTSVIENVTLADAIQFLKSRQTLKLDETVNLLTRTTNCLKMLSAFRDLFPDSYKEKIKGVQLKPGFLTYELTQPEDALLDAIHNEMFPIDRDAFEEWAYNSEADVQIQVEPYGMAISCEDVAEACWEGNEPFTGPFDTFLLLILYNGFGDETWEWADAFFHWNVPPPRSMYEKVDKLDWDKLRALLEDVGMGCIMTAIDIVGHDTGNLFIDYNPYDEYSYMNDMQPFTLETLKSLTEQWTEAQPLLLEWRTVDEMVAADPSIYAKVLEFWEQACVYKEDQDDG